MNDPNELKRPVADFISKKAVTLSEALTIDQAVGFLRATRPASEFDIVYFYVIDHEGRLTGVLPSRKLLLSDGQTLLRDVMTRNVVTIRQDETLFDALELFAMYRLLAIPVVDKDNVFQGILDVGLYTDEVFDLAQQTQLNEVFQLIGMRLEVSKHGSPFKGFKVRMPWLLANIAGGLICAALGSLFSATLEHVVMLALFVPLVLALAESVSMQSMTLAIESVGSKMPYTRQLLREVATALLLGTTSGLIVGVMSVFWGGSVFAPLVIGGSIFATMLMAATLGRLIPKFIYMLKLNPRVASGPLTLAMVDILTLTTYFSLGTILLMPS